MMYATGLEGEGKIKATPGSKAKCPLCESLVLAKCGSINIWHWAHYTLKDCDIWAEGETEWHLKWKSLVPKEFCEIKMGNHRADIKIGDQVIELQSSPISEEQIMEREYFYKNMRWVWDLTKNNRMENAGIYLFKKKGEEVWFRWKHPRKSLRAVTKGSYIDLGDKILKIEKIIFGEICTGYGNVLNRDAFMKGITNQANIFINMNEQQGGN